MGSAASTLLDCRCVAGYVCTYKKQIHAKITINAASVQAFNVAEQQAFKASVAKAASVTVENVNIVEIVSHGGRRLLAAMGHRHITVSVEIHGTATFNEEILLKAHGYVNNMLWEHKHILDVAIY